MTEKTAQEVTDMTTEQAKALEIYDESDFGAGFEDASQNSFSIPILRILQDQSPQVKRHNEKYIEGAKPGMIFNTVTKEV
ncbi:MAG TPA: hypothetical protein VLB84_05840, partial [Bacteroidia bacterium]|nr:hypothetical protein [Bacteroidia bacterium]